MGEKVFIGKIVQYLGFALKYPRKNVCACGCGKKWWGGGVRRWNQIDKMLIITDEYGNLIEVVYFFKKRCTYLF